jgi:hypothetical protein
MLLNLLISGVLNQNGLSKTIAAPNNNGMNIVVIKA